MNATLLHPARHTPCGYKNAMRQLPQLHDFLVAVANSSGSAVRNTVWTFIADNHLNTTAGQEAMRKFGLQPLAEVPDDCVAGARIEDVHEERDFIGRAAYFWEMYFVVCFQRSHPPLVAVAAD